MCTNNIICACAWTKIQVKLLFMLMLGQNPGEYIIHAHAQPQKLLFGLHWPSAASRQ